MTTTTPKSRECLMEDIKCLETKLSHLQERFDVIVTWIRSQYNDFTGLPDYVLIAVQGDLPFSEEKMDYGEIEHVKVEYDHFIDSTEDSTYLNPSDDTLADSQWQTDAVKVDDDILKGIEAGPVSRMRAQLQQRKLACRDISQNGTVQQRKSDRNLPATKVQEQSSSFPLLIEGDAKLKFENDQLADDDSRDCNKPDGNKNATKHRTLRDIDAPSAGFKNKRVKKTPEHLQINREKGLILDAVEYKERVNGLPKDRLNCCVCSKIFTTSTTLRRHEFEVHLLKEDRDKLRNRGRDFETLNVDAKTNVVTKSNIEPTMCDICNMSFKHIEAHKMNHLPPEVMTTVEGSWRPHYRCLKCNSVYSEKKGYLEHVLRKCKAKEILEDSNYAQHTQKLRTEKNFLCNQCGQAFNRKYTLKIHIVAVHAKRKDFKCKYCSKSFAVEFVKKNHEKKHLGMTSVTCDLCGFNFTCKKGLKKHIEGVHENRRPYQCQLCDKSFKTDHARKYHINTHGNPNGRKRGLNRDVDPIHAAAKRRNCITWKNNRVQPVEDLSGDVSEKSSVTKGSEEND